MTLNTAFLEAQPPPLHRGLDRVVAAAACCWCLFVNHYSRDVTGALEREIQADLGLTPSQCQGLNSVYFVPSIVAPLICGALAQRIGAPRMLIATQLLAAAGHLTVGLGGQLKSYEMLLAGRFILGVTYETTDALPLPILASLFADHEWGIVSGLFNAMLRLGSVVNFALSPAAYHWGGLPAALWLSCAMGISGLVAAVICWWYDARAKRERAELLDCETSSIADSVHRCEDSGKAKPWRQEMISIGARDKLQFVFFLLTGASLYTAIVPFWFFGTAFIRDKWGYSLTSADALMLFLEGGMVVISPPVGWLIDRSGGSLVHRVIGVSIGAMTIVLGFGLLVCFPAAAVPAFVPLTSLSISWAVTCTLFWSMSAKMIPKAFYAMGAGVIGAALNVGPSVLPLIMARASSPAWALAWLAGAAGVSSVMALLLLPGARVQERARTARIR